MERCEFEIPALNAEKTKSFLAYFRAEAKRHSESGWAFGAASADWNDDGVYAASQEGHIEGMPVTWHTTLNEHGSLVGLACSVPSTDANAPAREFVQRVLFAALSEVFSVRTMWSST